MLQLLEQSISDTFYRVSYLDDTVVKLVERGSFASGKKGKLQFYFYNSTDDTITTMRFHEGVAWFYSEYSVSQTFKQILHYDSLPLYLLEQFGERFKDVFQGDVILQDSIDSHFSSLTEYLK